MLNKIKILTKTAALLLVLLTACGPVRHNTSPEQNNDLLTNKWVLVSLNNASPIEGKQISLELIEETIQGSGGCNTYGGSYTASEDSLNLSDVYWTEMACMEPEGILEQEQAYFQTLNTAVRYRVDGDRLELYDKSGTQILVFVSSTSEALAEKEPSVETPPQISLDCSLEMDETYPVDKPVNLRFELHNQTDRTLYVLTWYTPLEGIAGEIFLVTLNGEKLPYQGMLVKRGDPSQDAFIAIEPGKVVSAEVDLRLRYDLSTPGSYQVQFTKGLQDVTDDASLFPQKQDNHQPQPLSCNNMSFRILPPPEPPTATPKPEPPANFIQYLDAASGVSLWLPESWTIIEDGTDEKTTILQSFPEDKYVGGEVLQSGDSKCDLTIHPSETNLADLVQQTKSNPNFTIVSEKEIVLQSGQLGTRVELESMGSSRVLFTEVNEQAVVLTCYGELTPFNEIATTIGTDE